MTTYHVEIDGVEVWTHSTLEYESGQFPDQYLHRPVSGLIHLYVDDVLIGVQEPYDADKEHANYLAQIHEIRRQSERDQQLAASPAAEGGV